MAFDIDKARLCAKLAGIAYLNEKQARTQFKLLGFKHIKFFDNGSSQAYVIHNLESMYAACRGTEIDQIQDLIQDGKFWPARAQKQGRVHTGFAESVDLIWTEMNAYLQLTATKFNIKQSDIYFTGHSLGGAMATVCAARSDWVANAYTYGGPRVGNRAFAKNVLSPIYRIRNEHDIVPSIVPPLGYYHSGVEYRLINGKLHRITGRWDSWKMQIRASIAELKKFQWIRSLYKDHGIDGYIENLETFELDNC